MMTISVLEGLAKVTASGVTAFVPPGARVHVPLDDSGAASGPPVTVEPYLEDTASRLPLQPLDQTVEIPQPLTETEIRDFLAKTSEGGGYIGSWETIDVDGSYETLDITRLPDGTFSVYMYDNGASVCGTDADSKPIYPAEVIGSGYLDADGTLVFAGTWHCLETSAPKSGSIGGPFIYDPGTDALVDWSGGIIWTRR